MTRWVATVALVFAVGAGVMSVFAGLLGELAEATALGVIGMALYGASFLPQGRPPAKQSQVPGRLPQRGAA